MESKSSLGTGSADSLLKMRSRSKHSGICSLLFMSSIKSDIVPEQKNLKEGELFLRLSATSKTSKKIQIQKLKVKKVKLIPDATKIISGKNI